MGEDGTAAATKVHAMQRGKMDRRKTQEKMEAKKQNDEMDQWTKEMGDEGTAAATKVQAMQRGKMDRRKTQEKMEAKQQAQKEREEENAGEDGSEAAGAEG